MFNRCEYCRTKIDCASDAIILLYLRHDEKSWGGPLLLHEICAESIRCANNIIKEVKTISFEELGKREAIVQAKLLISENTWDSFIDEIGLLIDFWKDQFNTNLSLSQLSGKKPLPIH